jgi:esterase/lipase superfamily enzyme
MTGGFGPPPPCGTPETLSFGTIATLPSPDPARPGQLAGPLATAGAVDCSNPGSDAPLVAHLIRILTAAAQAEQTPIVIVHGYSYSFTDAVIRAADLCAWFEGGDFPLALAPIAFTWPSVNGLSPDNYLADRARAAASANAYSRFIVAFAAASAAAGRPRCLYLAHSMGTWVSQNGLRTLAAGVGSTLPDDLFDQALVMAGDADTDALEPAQGLDQLARLSTWLTVGVNRTDVVTGVTATDILNRPRMGSSGPASVSKIPRNTRIVDYTLAIAADNTPTPPGETAWNYKLHQYYRTNPAIRDDIGAILSGAPPDDIDNRLTSAQMKKAGQASVLPGRLYLRPGPAAAPNDIGNPDRGG